MLGPTSTSLSCSTELRLVRNGIKILSFDPIPRIVKWTQLTCIIPPFLSCLLHTILYTHTLTLTHTHTHTLAHARTHTHTHTHTHLHMHTHTHTHTRAHAHTHTCTCTHTLAHAHTHTLAHAHTHLHTHAHTLAHAHTHTHTHTHAHTHTHTGTAGARRQELCSGGASAWRGMVYRFQGYQELAETYGGDSTPSDTIAAHSHLGADL